MRSASSRAESSARSSYRFAVGVSQRSFVRVFLTIHEEVSQYSAVGGVLSGFVTALPTLCFFVSRSARVVLTCRQARPLDHSATQPRHGARYLLPLSQCSLRESHRGRLLRGY